MAGSWRWGLRRRGGRRRRFRDGHVNLVGIDRRRVGDMVGVAQQQLQRVRSGGEREFSFRLAAAEMEMVLVVGNRLVEGRQIRVDEEVMVPRVGPLRSRRRNAHPMQAEMDCRFWSDDGAVLDVDEFNLGAGGGGCWSSLRGGLREGGGRKTKAHNYCDRRPSRPPHGRSPMILALWPAISARRQQFRLSRPSFRAGTSP